MGSVQKVKDRQCHCLSRYQFLNNSYLHTPIYYSDGQEIFCIYIIRFDITDSTSRAVPALN
jgi:hypothetical protein